MYCSSTQTQFRHEFRRLTIIPLIVAAFPFVARLVEASIREVDKGVIEAAQSMGCSPFQIIWKVMLPESRPSLISGFTTAFITILSYGAMAGAIGGGGLGSMALNLGYQRQMKIILWVSVVVLVILVQIFQSAGTRAAVRLDRRVGDKARRKAARKRKAEKAGQKADSVRPCFCEKCPVDRWALSG